MAAFEDMEAAACCLLRIIQDTPDLARSTKVAIAGEMAVRKYLPQYRHHMAGVRSCFIIPIYIERERDTHTRLTRPSKAST